MLFDLTHASIVNFAPDLPLAHVGALRLGRGACCTVAGLRARRCGTAHCACGHRSNHSTLRARGGFARADIHLSGVASGHVVVRAGRGPRRCHGDCGQAGGGGGGVPNGTQGLPLEECQKLLWAHWCWGRGLQASRQPSQLAGASGAGPGGISISSYATTAGGTQRSLSSVEQQPRARQRGRQRLAQSAGDLTPYRRPP